KAAPPKTAWMVSGGCARPIDDPLHRSGKQPPLSLADKQEAMQKTEAAPTAAPAAAMPTPPAAAPAGSQEALVAYHETMRQFLALQERVMSQYLGASPTVGDVGTAAVAMPKAEVAAAPATPEPVVAPPQSDAIPVAAEPEPQAAMLDYRVMLLATVVDLTGYPEEMIEADADLEADLGIDSIKRVEILGAFRKQIPV